MFFAIGFLVASLLGLVLIPLVHNRAVRLTMRRLEAATPLSMAEIQADKDQLRAEFAIATRRLELSIEQMKAKTTAQLAELGKKADAINRLKSELAERTATIVALEARESALKERLQFTEADRAETVNTLRQAERALAEKEAEVVKLSAELNEQTASADSLRIESATLHVQVDAFKERAADHEREAVDIGKRLARERQDAVAAAAALGRRVQEMESRLAEQARVLAEREAEITRLTETAAASQKTEAALRDQLTGTAERLDNDVLREQINDIAAEIARMTAALEGPGSPINAMLATSTPPSATGGAANAEPSLADRIRALQAKASRMRAAS